ncbi:hypothetical protein L3Y34_003052 [Caenorhabditis briggsae]|uniref:Protein CBR-FCD-2 n=1 Tax=Caenorhabditis briggsae TaxID=6238 RepID=A0AAE9D369_CAEBR|nr:hypothetical protein L3Y34_003052 [Caenorhabditis briggsae]
MSDEEFDSFDDGDDDGVLEIDEDEVENRNRPRVGRDLSMAMTQKLFGNLAGGASECHVAYDESAYVAPRNRFEEILAEEDVRIVNDHDPEVAMETDLGAYEKFVVFGGNLNHEDLCRNLEKRMEADRSEIFGEFETACNRDNGLLALYMSPSKSHLGLQDTLFRAFLQIRQTQTKSFALMLRKLNILAKKSENSSDLMLSQTCVAHMRHLNRLFDSQAIFNTIFEFEWRFWNPVVRNSFIAALPEIFTEISLQQFTAIRLNQQIQETQNVPDLASFQLQIVETLRLLRMDSLVSRQIRRDLCNLCMDLDVFCLPAVIAFSLGSLLAQPTGKSDDDETLFHEMLRQLSRLLKIDAVKKRTNKADVICTEIFAHFLKFLQLEKRSWKFIISWIAKKDKRKALAMKNEDSEKNEEGPEDVRGSSEEPQETAEEPLPEEPYLSSFEAFLIFSLLSNPESCPPGFVTAVNSKILNIPLAFSPKFLKIVDLGISFKKFSTTHLPALIHVARHCFWSPDANIRQMGVAMWKQLFVGMEKKERVRVFGELMKHFSQSEIECEAVLDVFFKVIKSTNSGVILEFSGQIQKCIELIHKLSIPNIKRLFQVMLLMNVPNMKSAKSVLFDIDEVINRFLISVNDREKFLGVLALLMKIQVEMEKKHSENQELLVREGIARIEDAIKTSSRLRGAFYEHLKLVLQQRKRSEEIRFFIEWSQNLLQRFKEDFFEFQEEMDQECTWILKPPSERLQEVIPMFELVLEMEHLKTRWKEEEEENEGMGNDTVVTKDLDFAFEALLPSQDEDLPADRDQKLDHLYFLIQMCRSVLNAFLTHSSSDDVAKIAIRQFKVMMEAEKKLAAGLGSGATWRVPNLEFKEITVSGPEKPKAKGGARKRKSDETTIIGATGDDLLAQEAEEEEDETEKNVPNLTLKSHFTCLRLRPLVHILKLAQKKRGCLKYLCDELQTVFDHIARSKKKAPPMLAARAITQKIDAFYHGDAASVWFCVRKSTEHIWEIVVSMFHFFSTLADASQQSSVQMQKDLEEMGEKSLKLMHCLLSGDLYGGEEKLSAVEKADRKSVIIRIIEKKMFGLERLSNNEEEARIEIGKFLAKSAEFSPTPAVAVALLNVFDDLKLDEEEQAETRKVMAKYALAYLKKDWSKVDEQWSRGTKYTNAVKDILQHYINLRREKDQLLAIQWILTNKVVQLVPEDDKRKSCVFSQQSDDEMLEKEDKKAVFYCISKTTFGVIFKTLFGCLNTRCLKYDMSGIAAKNRLVDEDETLESWEIASSCFLILCLFLRINKIRTTAVLTTAIREGKQFLITVSRKSSFIYLMENITKGTNFDVVCRRVEKILSAVQQGNRVLQSIGTYAKTQKCVHLLKRFPELRAENENCLRVIHSAMVKNECLNAFTVGLVKSRSIDGEIITNQPDSPMDSDDE